MKSLLGLTACCALLALSGPVRGAPCAGFTDVDDAEFGSGLGSFCAAIEWVRNRSITLGCSSTTLYCPHQDVSRAQMAMFLQRLGDRLTTRKLFVDANPGPVTLQGANTMVCQTPGHFSEWPQSAVLHGLVWGLVTAPVVWNADVWYSTDGGTTWSFATNFIPFNAATAAGGTQGSTFAVVPLEPDLTYTFAILLRESVDGPNGSGNFSDVACHLMAEIGNRNPGVPPYDGGALAVVPAPGGRLQLNR